MFKWREFICSLYITPKARCGPLYFHLPCYLYILLPTQQSLVGLLNRHLICNISPYQILRFPPQSKPTRDSYLSQVFLKSVNQQFQPIILDSPWHTHPHPHIQSTWANPICSTFKISWIHLFLLISTINILIQATNLPLLAYSNNFLIPIPASNFVPLECFLQEHSDLLKGKRDNVTPLLKTLQWLSILFGKSKILSLTLEVLHVLACLPPWDRLLPLSALLNVLQSYWPSWCFVNIPSMLPPQGFDPCYSLCLDRSSARQPHG